MNNSKKLKAKKVKKDRLIENKPITKISKPWIITAVVLVVILIGALLFDQFYEKTIMKIDGENYSMSDVAYYFYSVESSYDYYDQMFGGGGAYWDMTYDEESGATVRDIAKGEAVDSAIYYEILYSEAVAEGYTLSDDEKTTISNDVKTLLDTKLTSSQITKSKFTEEGLTEVLEKIALVTRYKGDKIDTFEINDAAIKEGINYDEYRQYDVEYLFISTNITDDEGNSVAMTEEEKSAAFDKINSFYETAKTTEDWSKLLPESEEEVTYADTNFLQSGSTFSEDMEAMMMAMENGDISDIYEAEAGYYVVRMKNNDSSESYLAAVESAISQAENEKFTEFYNEITTKHEYSTNDGALKSMTMGSITLD